MYAYKTNSGDYGIYYGQEEPIYISDLKRVKKIENPLFTAAFIAQAPIDEVRAIAMDIIDNETTDE